MADRTDELRGFMRQAKQDEAREATQFERLVKRFYVAQQKMVLSWGSKRHREVFGVPEWEKSADFVVSNGEHSLIIAEAKGSDIDHALVQLKNLAVHVNKKLPLMALEFHILLREGTDPDNLTPAKNQVPRYRARATNETLLWRNKYLLMDSKGEPVRLALGPRERGTKVFVIIGPRTGK